MGNGLGIYTIYIEDDRYSVPTIDILSADDDGHARVLAQGRLVSSPHYLSVEAWEDDRVVCVLPKAHSGPD